MCGRTYMDDLIKSLVAVKRMTSLVFPISSLYIDNVTALNVAKL